MPLTLSERIRYKIKTIQILKNWAPVWISNRVKKPLPELRLRDGKIIHHGSQDLPWFLFSEIFLEDCYLKKNFYRPRPGDIIVDIGANIGMFMLYFQWLEPQTLLYCFEPGRSSFQRLRENIETNHLQTQVQSFNDAVFDRKGELRLDQNAESGNRSIFGHSAEATTETVPCITLEEALSRVPDGPVSFLKIDTEGAEIEILEGALDAALERVRKIAVEFHDNLRPGAHDRVLRRLQKAGFRHFLENSSPEGVGLIRASR